MRRILDIVGLLILAGAAIGGYWIGKRTWRKRCATSLLYPSPVYWA